MNIESVYVYMLDMCSSFILHIFTKSQTQTIIIFFLITIALSSCPSHAFAKHFILISATHPFNTAGTIIYYYQTHTTLISQNNSHNRSLSSIGYQSRYQQRFNNIKTLHKHTDKDTTIVTTHNNASPLLNVSRLNMKCGLDQATYILQVFQELVHLRPVGSSITHWWDQTQHKSGQTNSLAIQIQLL